MRRLLIAALSLAIVAVGLSTWASGTRARAAVAHPRIAAVAHLRSSAVKRPRLALVPGSTACFVGVSECSQQPCVEFVGPAAAQQRLVPSGAPQDASVQQRLVAPGAPPSSARRLPLPQALDALLHHLAFLRRLADAPRRPLSAHSLLQSQGGAQCRRVGRQTERVQAVRIASGSSPVSLQQSAVAVSR